jgi:hypothetical protein
MPLFRSTWRLQNASCDNREVRGIYRRGDIVNVDRFINENPMAILDIIGESATFVKRVNQDFNRSEDRIPETYPEYRNARYHLIGSLQNRNVSYNLGTSSFNVVPVSDEDEWIDDGVDTDEFNLNTGTSIFDQIRSSRNASNRNNRNVEAPRERTYRERYEAHIKEDEMSRLTVSDLPDEYINELNNIYAVDWATQQLTLSTQTTLDWFENIIPNINGLRVNEIRVDITQSSQIEWRLNGTFYYREQASIQGE